MSPAFNEAGIIAWVVRHPVNLGRGAGLQTAITFALSCSADHVITVGADGQHQATDLRLLPEPLISGRADFAPGSRALGATVGAPSTKEDGDVVEPVVRSSALRLAAPF